MTPKASPHSLAAPISGSQQAQLRKFRRGGVPITLARSLVLPPETRESEVHALALQLGKRHPSLSAIIDPQNMIQYLGNHEVAVETVYCHQASDGRAAALQKVTQTTFDERSLVRGAGSLIRLYRSPSELIMALYCSHVLVDGYGITNAIRSAGALAAGTSDNQLNEGRALQTLYHAKYAEMEGVRKTPVAHWEQSFDGYQNIPTEYTDTNVETEAIQFDALLSANELKLLNATAFRKKTGLSLLLMHALAQALAVTLDCQRICIRSITHNRRSPLSQRVAGYLAEDFGMFFGKLKEHSYAESIARHSELYLRSLSLANSFRAYDPPEIRTTDVQYQYTRQRTSNERARDKSLHLKNQLTTIPHKIGLSAKESGSGLALKLYVNSGYYTRSTAAAIWAATQDNLKKVHQL